MTADLVNRPAGGRTLEAACTLAVASVLVTGAVAWVFPHHATALVGAWFLPSLSILALGLAVVCAGERPVVRALVGVLGLVALLGWNGASQTSTSHVAGLSLGLLLMVAIGRFANTEWRLGVAIVLFLGVGAAALLVGLAGASIRVGTVLDSLLGSGLPRIRLGLAGLESDGDVNPNALAAAALLVLPLGIAVLRTGRRTVLPGTLAGALAVLVIGAITLAICQSRTALVSIWLISVGSLVRGMRGWIWRSAAGLIAVAPLLVAGASLTFLSQERVLRQASNSWTSAHGRAQIMSQAVERWRDSPWLGIGLNEFRSVYAPREGDLPQATDIAHAHNIVLQTALDVGVVGSAAYWGLMFILWDRARAAAGSPSSTVRSAALGSGLALVAVTLFGLADAVPLGAKIGILQWAAAGLILAAHHVHAGLAGSATINHQDFTLPCPR